MADQPDDDAGLTPIQRALKMKKAAIAAKAPPPGAQSSPTFSLRYIGRLARENFSSGRGTA